MKRETMKHRLRWAHDQCPLPGSSIPSLHHTHWYATGHNDPNQIIWQPDGYTIPVIRSKYFNWYRSFSTSEPNIDSRKAWITISEWLPRYEPTGSSGWIMFGRQYTGAYASLHVNYLNDWRKHARRHLKLFQKSGCTLRLGTRNDVISLYAVSQVPKSLQKALLTNLDKHLNVHAETIDILIACKEQKPVACLVSGNCDEEKMSEYIIGAFHPQYKQDHAMVGLVNWWYQRSRERNYTTLTFGFIEPSAHSLPWSGKGYSFFKTHFGIERIWFPKNRWRFFIHKPRNNPSTA